MNTLTQRLRELAQLRDDDTPVTRLLFEAALEIEKLQARVATLEGENKTLRETPTGVAATQYRRRADESESIAQECGRLIHRLALDCVGTDGGKATVETVNPA